MFKNRLLMILSLVFWFFFYVGSTLVLAEGSVVEFSGKVKKVLVEKNKVGIKDPKTKKRFTVVINGDSKLEGFSSIKDVKKGDLVGGSYVVTSGGKYIAQKLTKK
jgi:hypothetical protein